MNCCLLFIQHNVYTYVTHLCNEWGNTTTSQYDGDTLARVQRIVWTVMATIGKNSYEHKYVKSNWRQTSRRWRILACNVHLNTLIVPIVLQNFNLPVQNSVKCSGENGMVLFLCHPLHALPSCYSLPPWQFFSRGFYAFKFRQGLLLVHCFMPVWNRSLGRRDLAFTHDVPLSHLTIWFKQWIFVCVWTHIRII